MILIQRCLLLYCDVYKFRKNYSRCYNNIGIILEKKGIMMVLKKHIVNQLNLTTLMEIDVLIPIFNPGRHVSKEGRNFKKL